MSSPLEGDTVSSRDVKRESDLPVITSIHSNSFSSMHSATKPTNDSLNTSAVMTTKQLRNDHTAMNDRQGSKQSDSMEQPAQDSPSTLLYIMNSPEPDDSPGRDNPDSEDSSNKTVTDKTSVKYKSLNKSTQKSTPEMVKNSVGTLSSSINRKNYSEEGEETDSSSTSANKSTEKVLVNELSNQLQIASFNNNNSNKCDAETATIGIALSSDERDSTKPVCKVYAFRFAEMGLRRALWYLARAVAARQILFSLLPITLVLFSLIGPLVHYDNLRFSPPFESFFEPSMNRLPSSSVNNPRLKQLSSSRFNVTNPSYATLHRNSPSQFGILIKTRDRTQSVLNEKTLNVYHKVREIIQNIRVTYERNNVTWSELCRESCKDDDDVIRQITDNVSKISSLTFPEAILSPKDTTTKNNNNNNNNENKNLTRLFLGLSIGGVEIDMDGAIASALALNHLIRLKDNFRPEILKDWDKQFRDQMQHEVAEVERETDAGLYWWSYREFIEDVQSSFKKMHATLIFSGYILIFLCLLACLTTNAYQSKPVLGAIIGMIIIICCIVGFAVQFAGAASFNVVVFPVFFIISGIGLLILFSLESTWSKYSNAACDPLEKLSLIMSWDGPCAAISSLIIIIAFLIVGSSTANPYLQYVSFVLAAAIAILLIFTVLFFTVFLYMSGRHETMGLKWYQCLQPGDSHFAPRTIKDYNEVSISLLHDKLVEIKPTIAHLVASLISNHYVKCPIAFIFAIYLVFAVWGCKDFNVDLREEYFLSRSSESRLYMQQYRDMFGKYEEYLELIFDEPIDYHDRARKQEILTFIDWPVQNQLATRSVSWLKDFSRFESSTIYEINSDTFVPIVSLVFLKADNFKKYHSDIVFDKYQTQIIASKMYIELSTKGVEERLSLIDDLIAKAKSLGLPLTIKAPFAFSIQHDLQVISTVLVAFAILLCCVCGLSLFLYGIPSLTVLVFLSNLSVIIGVIGYAVYWNIPVNIITLSIALSGNALTTVIVAHFCYHYATAGNLQKGGEQRVKYSFQSCLLPVTFACFIPLLTYLPLLYIDVPIVVHIFKILFLTSVISYAHFLLFLPSMMMFLTEQVPSFCKSLQSLFDDCCCYCFDMEEDVGSIYYIPTGGHSINTEQMQTFSRQYSYALSAATRSSQAMIMPPPPGYIQLPTPVLVPDVLPYHRNGTMTTVDGAYRTSTTVPQIDTYSEHSTATSPRIATIRSMSQTPRRERRREALPLPPLITDERPRMANEESIYEEPPSPSLTQNQRPLSPPVIQQQHQQQHQERRQRKSSSPESRRSEMRRENLRSVDMQEQRHQHQYPKQYEAQTPNQTQTRFFSNDRNDREPAIEMNSNWRQYLLEGNIRQPRHSASTSQNSNSSSLQTAHTYSSPPTYRTQQHVRPSRSNATRSIRY